MIHVENIGKRYRLGVINRGMLYKDLQSWWARIRGKEDPNATIALSGEKKGEVGQEFWAIRNVSFCVKQGEIVGVVGRNGAGKSTLLKVLSQITAPTEGTVRMGGRVASLLEVGTGFHSELTGRENIFLNGAILGMSRAEVRAKFDQIVDFAEIGKFIDTPVKRYSSGMYVRLAFAVAAHLEPEILIVDEVLAVGDAQFQKKCMGKMDEVASRDGRTILFVSHNMSAVRALCTRALLIEDGRLTMDGSTEEVVGHYLGGDRQRGINPLDHCKHTGSGRLRVVRCHLENAQGDVIQDVGIGNEVVFVVEFENKSLKASDRVSASISVFDSNEQPLFHHYSHFMGVEFQDLPKRGTFRFLLPSMDLIPGNYFIGMRIIANGNEHLGELLDNPEIALPFHVHAADYYGMGTSAVTNWGTMLVRGEWSMRSKGLSMGDTKDPGLTMPHQSTPSVAQSLSM